MRNTICAGVLLGTVIWFLSLGMSRADEPPPVKMMPPNELGKIMVVMYHDIGQVESTWRRTPQNFLRDLDALYRRHYYPVSLTDLVTGEFEVPKGKAPVVITFDDGYPGQFQWDDDSSKKDISEPVPSPDTAVGMLMAFQEAHPDFPAKATFFLHGKHPFGQKSQVAEKLRFLVANGMDIGNHLTRHQNLGKKSFQSAGIIQKAIGQQAQYLASVISPQYSDYEIDTLALCYGRRPRPALQRFLEQGVVDGFRYKNIAILNVGAGPTPSPFDRRFKPLAIPRIRASEINTFGTGLYDWLIHFDQNPEQRFISDGSKKHITIPINQSSDLNTTFTDNLEFEVQTL